MIYVNGDIYSGQWKNGKKEGEKDQWDEDGVSESGDEKW